MNIGPIYFLKPQMLNWILLLPVVYLIFILMEKKRKSALERFVASRLWSRVIPELDWSLIRRKFFFWCVTFFWILVALSRPQWGEKEDIVPTNGFDVILAIDVSNSMLAEDVIPSRLKKTKRFVKNLLERLSGDRVGLVAFAGTSQLLAPLTTDLEYVGQLVESLATDSVGAQGTDLGGAIESSARALDRGAEQNDPDSPLSKASRIVIVISDGEDHEEQIAVASKKISEETLNVYAFGVGTPKGGPIPIRDADGRSLGYKRDRSGTTVTTKLSSEGLAKLAQAGSGKYWTLSPGEGELDEFMETIDTLTRVGGVERRVVLREDRFQIPLALAIFFLLIELLSRSRIAVKDEMQSVVAIAKTTQAAKNIALVWIVWSLAPDASASTKSLKAYDQNRKAIDSAQAGKTEDSKKRFADALTADPDSAEIVHNQGVLQLQEKKLKEAAELFESSAQQAAQSEQYDLQARSLYDLGITKSASEDRNGAVDAYIRALESLRKSPDKKLEAMVRHNLELLFKKQDGKSGKDDKDKKDQKDDKKDPSQSDSKSDQKKDGKDGKDSDEKNKSGNQSGDSKEEKNDEQKKEDQEKDGDQDKKDRQAQAPKAGKQRDFKSLKLSKDDAERVMQGLAEAEERLQERMKRQKGRPQGLEKDW